MQIGYLCSLAIEPASILAISPLTKKTYEIPLAWIPPCPGYDGTVKATKDAAGKDVVLLTRGATINERGFLCGQYQGPDQGCLELWNQLRSQRRARRHGPRRR